MKRVCASPITLVWGIQLLALSGCAGLGENVSKKGLVTVERVSASKVVILWADVYRTDEELSVRGAVRRREYSSQPLLVHVDASILSGNGAVLAETMGQDVWVPRRLVGKDLHSGNFEIDLPMAPPEGGTVKLVCHPGPGDAHLAMSTTQK